MPRLRFLTCLAIALVAGVPAVAHGQLRKLRVVASDGQPIAFAFVTVEGGTGQITDEKGEISLGGGKSKTVTVNVRRIGYQQWFGKLELPDTAAVLSITMPRIAQTLDEIRVSGNAGSPLSIPMKGFYDRWQMRQKGLLSATFIGPEEIEFRHPDRITNMLRGLNGVSFRQSSENELVAFGYGGQCQMAIMVDGMQQCPMMGCKTGKGGGRLSENNAVLIDRVINAYDVTAIEVYARGGNMPVSLQVSDPICGVIAFWTGSRKP